MPNRKIDPKLRDSLKKAFGSYKEPSEEKSNSMDTEETGLVEKVNQYFQPEYQRLKKYFKKR